MADNQIAVSTFMLASCKKILRIYTDYVESALDGYDLSPNEIIVLSSLGTSSTASQIAADFDVSKALVSRSVKRLKTLNYITVAISETDKREQLLTLTEEGRAIADKIERANVRFGYSALDRMTEDQRNALRMMLKLIVRNLDNGGNA